MRVFILSRFNTTFRGVGYERAGKRRLQRRSASRQFDRKWIIERLELMNRFTAPSIKSQTDPRFEWYVFVQDRTPQDVIVRIKEMGAQVVVAETDDVDAAQKLIRKNRGMIVTVNLDTDDAIAPTFVQELHAHISEQPGMFRFKRGMVIRQQEGRELYAMGYKSDKNQFNALVERGEEAITVFGYSHAEAGRVHDIHRPMWLQVVHGDNIDNWRLRKAKKDRNQIHLLSEYFTVNPKSE